MEPVKFYQDNANEWRWRVTAPNGEILGAVSEGYSSRSYAENNLKALPLFCLPVDIKVASENPGNSQRPLEFYQDKAGEWRWHIKAANGHITHASSEGFASKQNAIDNVEKLIAAVLEWNVPS